MTYVNHTLKLSTFKKNIPDSWPLLPVRGKRPLVKGWLTRAFTDVELDDWICSGRASGVGLRLGDGFLAVDVDGDSAWALLRKLAPPQSLADFDNTTVWSSDRPGRKQFLFVVSEQDWARIRNIRIPTGAIDGDGNSEFLEFRWSGQQSVLPPSLHPDTGKPYRWLKNPIDFPPLPAPRWLLDVIENYHSEYSGVDELEYVRVPARLYSHFGRQMGVWLLARRFDVSRWENSGRSKGSGIGKFTLKAASVILRRSPGHIRKLLCAAKNSGLIRSYKQCGDWITVFYSSLQKAIALADISTLGPVASVPIDLLSNLHILCTEIEAQSLQRQSFYRESQKVDAQNRPLIGPAVLQTSDKLAGVLGRGRRFLFCDRDFRYYGGSQKSVSDVRGLHPATISRHLSNSYRLAASTRLNLREDLAPMIKKQLAEHIPLSHKIPAALCREDGLINMGGEWFRPRCNVYFLNHRLVSARFRRISEKCTGGAVEHKSNLCLKKSRPGDLDDKNCLSLINRMSIDKTTSNNFLDSSQDKSSVQAAKKPGQ